MMKRWVRLGVILGALVFATAIGAGAYAMRGGSESASSSSPDGTQAARPSDGGAAVSAMCAADHPDCEDMIVLPDGDARCAADCVEPDAPAEDCPPDMTCIEPRLPEPSVCPDDVPVDVCHPDAQPAGPYVCDETDGEPALACEPPICATPEATPATAPDATPIGPEDPPVRCKPVEPCGDAATDGCLPPDCAVSSDGSLYCPDPGEPVQGGAGSSPGSAPPGEAGPDS